MKGFNGGISGVLMLMFILVLYKTLAIPEKKPISPKAVQAKEIQPPADTLPSQIKPKPAVPENPKRHTLTERLISFGITKIGTPYVYGGTSENGFDCSGFVNYAFARVGIQVPRSSELLSKAGKPILRQQARKGDILIFTGTNPKERTPGHVGIVISKRGEPIAFVHASSNGGVKISEVEGTNYERRFLEVRRVL